MKSLGAYIDNSEFCVNLECAHHGISQTIASGMGALQPSSNRCVSIPLLILQLNPTSVIVALPGKVVVSPGQQITFT